MNTASRIVVGIDGSPASTAALTWAVRHAKTTGSPVLAVSVCTLRAKPPSSSPMPITRPVGEDPFREQHVRNLRNAVEQVDQDADGIVIDQLVPTGDPGAVLVELSAGADALVLGGHGYRKSGVTVIGSVAAYCLRHASCPVTVVPLAALEDGRLAVPGAAQEFR
ncbi:universal stress protein [Umezawaea endophytica]|uniref:Universal stress protein n=1 Tax=Umezawaea endophytica TaxID=1654476 RepID=A0A9X3AL02_9PSEU|nr:universal stress protein [Umezawaea endophytica]MCS7483690.1 universal stress protein [Umezawaea endophytica]